MNDKTIEDRIAEARKHTVMFDVIDSLGNDFDSDKDYDNVHIIDGYDEEFVENIAQEMFKNRKPIPPGVSGPIMNRLEELYRQADESNKA